MFVANVATRYALNPKLDTAQLQQNAPTISRGLDKTLNCAYEVVVIISLHSTPEGELSQENEHFQENLYHKLNISLLALLLNKGRPGHLDVV